jgi:hypothetical protein
MPRGNTTTIDVQTLRMQWASHSTMASICTYWSISRDQLIRLRDVYSLAKRHDRTKRRKGERYTEPARAERLASEKTLSLPRQSRSRRSSSFQNATLRNCLHPTSICKGDTSNRHHAGEGDPA